MLAHVLDTLIKRSSFSSRRGDGSCFENFQKSYIDLKFYHIFFFISILFWVK